MKTDIVKQLERERRDWHRAAKAMSRSNAANAGPLWDRVERIDQRIAALTTDGGEEPTHWMPLPETKA